MDELESLSHSKSECKYRLDLYVIQQGLLHALLYPCRRTHEPINY